MAEWLIVALTLVIAVFTVLVWKVYERIAWFTGAMETHSDIMMRIEALRGVKDIPIELVWWDPTLEPIPVKKEHGQPVDMSRIYVGLPLNFRDSERALPSTWKKLLTALPLLLAATGGIGFGWALRSNLATTDSYFECVMDSMPKAQNQYVASMLRTECRKRYPAPDGEDMGARPNAPAE